MKNTTTTIKAQKGTENKISMITAYDYSMAKLVDSAGVNTILVGDSLGNVMLGYEDTVSVTMEDMIHHSAAVARGAKNALVVTDMPFMSYQTSVYDAVVNAGRLMKEGRAGAVKLEGGVEVCPQIKAITAAGIPVCAHLGLTPQSINMFGGFKVQGKDIEAAQKLIEYSGGYIAAPSANTSGRPSPTMASHVEEDLDGKIDMILDGGPVGIGLESTIVDFTEEIPTILRPGYINQEMVRRVIGQVQMDRGLIQADSKVKPKAPGMKYRHYAPKADLTVVEGSPKAVQEKICALVEEKIRAGEKVGVIATEESIKAYPEGIVKCIGTRADEESIARHLFAVLREFDDCGVTYIYSEAFDTPQMGQAIMNRLMKAAGQKKIQV